MVGLFSGVFWRGIIRSVEVKRIDLFGFDELQYLHGARRGWIEFVKLVFREEDVLIFLVLIPLDNFGTLDLAIAGGAELRLANARVTHPVELIEADALRSRGGKQPDGNGNQAEGEMALPDRRCHET